MTVDIPNARLTRKGNRTVGGYTDTSWYSQDRTIEVRPVYEPSLRGGSVSRPSGYVIISKVEGERQRSAYDLENAREIVGLILHRRTHPKN